jgi:sec-independent protein translocase protein TatC
VLKKYDEDLFKDSTMTFGEHLEELRKALFRALLWLVAGCVVGFYFGDTVVAYINTPLVAALERYYLDRSVENARREFGGLTPAQEAGILERRMVFEPAYIEPQAVADTLRSTFPDASIEFAIPQAYISELDLKDVRLLGRSLQGSSEPSVRIWQRLPDSGQAALAKAAAGESLSSTELKVIRDSLNSLLDKSDLYDEDAFPDRFLSDSSKALLEKEDLTAAQRRELNWHLLHDSSPNAIAPPHPTMIAVPLWRPVKYHQQTHPQSLSVQEGFFLWMKASILTGFVIASPMIFYHLWMFVAAGLYPHERRYVYVFLPFSIALFVGGVCLALFYVFEPVLNFFFNFNADLGIDPDPRIGEWLGFFLFLPFGFGIAFQLPIVMLFLERIGIFTVQSYLAKWKMAVFIIVVLACVLTPADPISFMFLGVPLLALYFIGIGLCMIRPRTTAPAIT